MYIELLKFKLNGKTAPQPSKFFAKLKRAFSFYDTLVQGKTKRNDSKTLMP